MTATLTEVVGEPAGLEAETDTADTVVLPGQEPVMARRPLFLGAMGRRIWSWLFPRRSDQDMITRWSSNAHLMNDIGFVAGRGQDHHHR